MPNLLPTLFIALAALALVLTLLWLWQSLRLAFVHTLGAPPPAAISTERATLLAEKQSLLMALKDLEAERDASKLSLADFNELNIQYRKRAREVLRELDALLEPHRSEAQALLAAAAGGAPVSVAAISGEPVSLAAISGAPVSVAAISGASVSLAAISGEPASQSAASSACASCGTGNDADAVFCKKCGARLRAESGT